MRCHGIKKSYFCFVQGENRLRHLFLFIIRVYWGTLLLLGGLGKVINSSEIALYFATLKVPAPLLMTYVVGSVEFLAGLSFVVGFLSRLFSFIMVIILSFAFGFAHRESVLQFFQHPQAFFQEEPFLYLFTALILLCFGAGAISLDYWMEKKLYGQAL